VALPSQVPCRVFSLAKASWASDSVWECVAGCAAVGTSDLAADWAKTTLASQTVNTTSNIMRRTFMFHSPQELFLAEISLWQGRNDFWPRHVLLYITITPLRMSIDFWPSR